MALASLGPKETSLSATIQDGDQENHSHTPAKKDNRWIQLMTALRWYPKDMPAEEKLLILKLDLSILIFGCTSFFTKYLDQQSTTNAYVRSVALYVFRYILQTLTE